MLSRVAMAVAALLAAAAVGCGSDESSDEGGGGGGASAQGGEPILIGIAAAKTGIYEPYDLQAGQLLEMRLNEINDEGGVLGSKFEVEWIDTKSDKPRAGTAARELISNGAKVIVGTCDFDYSFPAMQAASSAGVVGMALCASSPKAATPAIVGQTAGTMGLGSDTEGVAMANWLNENKPEMKRAYIFTDTSIQYSKATADYFKAQWQELGGELCGEDQFVGSPTLNLSSQITRLSGKVDDCDVIYDGSTIPFGAQLIRSIRDAGIDTPIATNAAVNGTAVTEIGGRVSDVYSMGFACVPTYCEGGDGRGQAGQRRLRRRVRRADRLQLRAARLRPRAPPSRRRSRRQDSTETPAIAEALFNSGDDVRRGDRRRAAAPVHRGLPPAAAGVVQHRAVHQGRVRAGRRRGRGQRPRHRRRQPVHGGAIASERSLPMTVDTPGSRPSSRRASASTTRGCGRSTASISKLAEGEIVGLIGPNGAGKTTFLNAVSRFVGLTDGCVTVGGKDVTDWPPHRLMRCGMVRTFQEVATFPSLTVFENVELGALGGGALAPQGAGAGPRAARGVRALRPGGARGVGAAARSGAAPGGSRARWRRARGSSCSTSPPPGSTTPRAWRSPRTIRDLRDDLGCAVLLVEHDMRIIFRVCQRIQVLDFGRTPRRGSPEEIRSDSRCGRPPIWGPRARRWPRSTAMLKSLISPSPTGG